jgi:CDGSH-type Zn-finger protein
MTETSRNSPFVMDVCAGNYAWCSCGLSQTQPYCDGSHRGSGKRPMVLEIEEDKKVAWCGCKKTGTPPFCDGSHAKC